MGVQGKRSRKKNSHFLKSTKGAAGTHFVVAELSLRGHVALPTTRNLQKVDIVAFNQKMTGTAFIQVKSTDAPGRGWPIYTIRASDDWEAQVREKIALSRQFFYVFVALPHAEQERPVFYIVPSGDVAEYIIASAKAWVAGKPGRSVDRQLCTWRCASEESIQKYKERWENLGLDNDRGA